MELSSNVHPIRPVQMPRRVIAANKIQRCGPVRMLGAFASADEYDHNSGIGHQDDRCSNIHRFSSPADVPQCTKNECKNRKLHSRYANALYSSTKAVEGKPEDLTNSYESCNAITLIFISNNSFIDSHCRVWYISIDH